MGDSHAIRFISDAVINLYAAHVHSLLYPYDHPLVSDSLKNAFQCLQKAFRKKHLIRLETAEGRLMVDGEVLGGDIPQNFACWINSRNIKGLSFAPELTRRDLIIIHRIISMKKLTVEELSKAVSEKGITSIVVHPADLSGADGGVISLDDTAEGGLVKGYVSTMYSMESSQAHSPFFVRPAEAGPLDEAATHGAVRDYVNTMYQSEGLENPFSFDGNSVEEGSVQEMSEDARYAECVEALLEGEIPEEDKCLIRGIPPQKMAHLLNAMLFRVPGRGVADRVVEVYFRGAGEVRSEGAVERCKLFLTGLKPDLQPLFAARCASFCAIDGLYPSQADILSEAGTSDSRGREDGEGMPSEGAAFALQRAIGGSDFTFDFVAHGNAVLHDLEIPGETAGLFNGARLSQGCDGNAPEALPSAGGTADEVTGSLASLVAECTDEAITNTSFDVMLELIESNSLDGNAYRKLEGRLSTLVEYFLERAEFEKVLEIANSLRTQSLQGRWGAYASTMSRSIFSPDKFNAKVTEALRLHGRKQRERAVKLTNALRSFLIPYLLDALSEEVDTSTRRFMISLLASVMSNDVLDHIVKRLRDSRWYVLRNMLYLLRECRGRSHASEVRTFLEHEVPLVCLEALRTLLSFQDPGADSCVIRFLKSDVFQLQKGAVRLAGAYRIKGAVPYMVRLLGEKDILGKKTLFKKGIVRALGRIGDGRAAGPLLDICRAKSVLHKDDLDTLRIEIFRTIHNYPASAIGPLIDYGMRSTNEEIAAICRRLISRYGLSVEGGG